MALHYAKIYQNVWAIAVHCWRKFRADILTRSDVLGEVKINEAR